MKTLDLGITFDDKAVEEWFEKEGMKQAIDRASAEIVRKVELELINKGYRTPGGLPVHADWYAWLKDMAEEAVNAHKDEVIALSTEALARKTKQSQKYRDIVKILMSERNADASDDSIQ